MHKTKIVVIGAGSASFGPGVLADVMRCEALYGSTLALVDIDADRLEVMAKYAARLNEASGADLHMEAFTDRMEALPGAEFVITAIAVRRNFLWRQDYEIPLRYGFKQVLGENGGPGGLFHTLRNVPLMLDICRDMEELCPGAWLLNYTNPESRICLAINRFSSVKVVGLCHGYYMGLGTIADITGVPAEDLQLTATGLNHFLWLLSAYRKSTGEDVYPLLRSRLDDLGPDYLPFSVKLCTLFGLFPFPSDDHVGEYLGFAWDDCLHHGYDFDAADARNREAWERIICMANGEGAVYGELHASGEGGIDIVRAMLTGESAVLPAVIIPNCGCIANLPHEAVVEVPAVADATGIHGICVGALPPAIAALCRTQADIQQLAVEAAVTGSRELALQALLLDPVVNNIAAAEQCLDEMLALQAEYLPRFAVARGDVR